MCEVNVSASRVDAHSVYATAQSAPCQSLLDLFYPLRRLSRWSAAMATMDYVEIPSYATRLRSDSPSTDLRPAPKIVTSLPRPEHSPVRSSSSPASTQPMSPSRAGGSNLTSILLTSALQLPANTPTTPRTYGKAKDAPRLLSTRDPLSIPITTVNFRRFVARAGPIFWLQDRVEEIVLWKRSWKYTLVWMAAYAFLCTFVVLVVLRVSNSLQATFQD